MEFNVADLFEAAVDAYPDRVNLVIGGQRCTFAEMEQRSNRMAHHLQSVGVRPGDRVAIYARNGMPWVETLWATYKLRAVSVNVNFRYVEGELRHLLDDSEAKVLVLDDQFVARLDAIRSDLAHLEHVVVIGDGAAPPVDAVDYETALAAQSPARDFGPRSGDDHYMLYTGGTTGMPKGVVWRQEDFVLASSGLDYTTGQFATKPDDLTARGRASDPSIGMSMAPLMHANAQWAVMSSTFVGNTTVLMRKFEADEALALIETEGVRTLSVLGDAMARPLAEALQANPGRHDLSSLFAINSSAAVLSPAIRNQLLDILPNVLMSEATGASETTVEGMTVHVKGNNPASALRFIPGSTTAIIGEDGQLLTAPGSVGRIGRTGHIPLGYYKAEAKTAETFVTVEGKRYVVPGDFARIEDDGFVTLLGRGSVSINSGGEKVFPEEVESAVKSHPAIYDAVAVGVPDDRLGNRVCVVVQARDGAVPTLEELQEHCRPLIAGYKLPRQLHIVDSLNRHDSGKPDYRWARDRVLGDAAGSHVDA